MTGPVVRDWDTPGLPPRTKAQRCSRHGGHCGYRDDDPAYCPRCHMSWAKAERCDGGRVAHLVAHDHADALAYAANLRRSRRHRSERARRGTQLPRTLNGGADPIPEHGQR